MALEIFRLVGSIFVDNDEANKSIAKTDEKAQGVGKTLANGVATAGKWAAGIAAGAAAAATGIAALTATTAANLDETDKASQRMKVSAEAYQELAHAAELSGVEMSTLESAAKKLEGTGLNLDDALSEIYELQTAEERAAAASELFGERVAYNMTPLLNASAEEFAAMRQEANDLGLVMSQETVTAGARLNDVITNLKEAFGAVATRLGSALLPIVQKAADFIIEWLPEIQAMIEQLAPVVAQLLEDMLPPLMQLVTDVFPMLASLIGIILPIVTEIAGKILPVFVELLNKVLPVIIQIASELLPPILMLLSPILDLLSPLLQLLNPILTLVTALLSPLASLISDLLTPLITVITKVIDWALKPLETALNFVSEIIGTVVAKAIEGLVAGFQWVVDKGKKIVDFFKNDFSKGWKAAWENVGKIFSNIWEGIKNGVKIPINWIIDGINTLIRGLNKIKIPDWVPGLGGKGFYISELPHLAAGGVLERGQVGLLEGSGAEAVVPLENNERWISAVAKDMKAAVGNDEKLDAIIALLQQIISMGLYLDGDQLVGGIARRMDAALGRLDAQKARV